VSLIIRDASGSSIRQIEGSAKQGMHRVAWDLRLQAPDPVVLDEPELLPPWRSPPKGPLAPPGQYQVELRLVTREGDEQLGQPQRFQVKPHQDGTLPPDLEEVSSFQRETGELMRQIAGAAGELERTKTRSKHLRQALKLASDFDRDLLDRLYKFDQRLAALKLQLIPDELLNERNEPSAPSIRERVGRVASMHWETRQLPTNTQRRSVDVARQEFAELLLALSSLIETDLTQLEADVEASGAPWTPGRRLKV
jgi:hypothetical protein